MTLFMKRSLISFNTADLLVSKCSYSVCMRYWPLALSPSVNRKMCYYWCISWRKRLWTRSGIRPPGAARGLGACQGKSIPPDLFCLCRDAGYIGGGVWACVGVERIANRRQRLPSPPLKQVHYRGIIFPPSAHCALRQLKMSSLESYCLK